MASDSVLRFEFHLPAQLELPEGEDVPDAVAAEAA